MVHGCTALRAPVLRFPGATGQRECRNGRMVRLFPGACWPLRATPLAGDHAGPGLSRNRAACAGCWRQPAGGAPTSSTCRPPRAQRCCTWRPRRRPLHTGLQTGPSPGNPQGTAWARCPRQNQPPLPAGPPRTSTWPASAGPPLRAQRGGGRGRGDLRPGQVCHRWHTGVAGSPCPPPSPPPPFPLSPSPHPWLAAPISAVRAAAKARALRLCSPVMV
jgi:hypothetical protein